MKLNWNEAINYAFNQGKFIPTFKECKELKLEGCWSCTTDAINIHQAYVAGEGKVNKNELREVYLIDETNNNQDPSYAIGDNGTTGPN